MNLLLKILSLVLISSLAACDTETENAPIQSNFAVKAEKPKNDAGISFSSAHPVDSTGYVIYPVYTTELDDESSYKRDGKQTYRNLIFYNTATGESHLLDKRKMLITSYMSKYADAFSSEPELIVKTSNLIFYTVIVDDYNGDGELGTGDPEYLFISDKQGSFFKQISPDNMDVLNYKEVKGKKIVLELTEDTNSDKKFNEDDNHLAYVFDIKDGKIAKPVFSNVFTDSVRNLLNEQWAKKK